MNGTILYVGNFELPDKGASANRVVSNGKLFAKLGYGVAYLGVRKQGEHENVTCLDEEKGMYEEPYPSGLKGWISHMFSTKNIEVVIEQCGDVCMVILYNTPFSLLLRAKAVLGKRKIRVVYDCTEWTPDTDGSILKRIVKRMDCYLIKHFLPKAADGMIVVSSRMKKAYEKGGHLLHLPPLVDLKDDIWHCEKLEKREPFTFCFAGGLDGNKERLDLIVEAIGELKQGKALLRIIGVTEEEFCAFYPRGRALLQKAQENVCFMGKRTHRETMEYVANCDCVIFIREADMRNQAGFPTKFVEAYTCGVPILTTDVSDVRTYADESVILLDEVSVDAITKAMSSAVHDIKQEERTLNETFHYETYEECCREWLENN